ncbi:hypothetical protein [uncultured Cohaesibacter sp.]|nr:hypothetical protein [uncultured Cohaesibacter sp.]
MSLQVPEKLISERSIPVASFTRTLICENEALSDIDTGRFAV